MKRIQYSKEISLKLKGLLKSERNYQDRMIERIIIPTTHEISIAVGITKAECEVLGQLTCHLLTETIRP